MDKKVIGVFQSEEEAIREIEKLEREGYTPCDIYAVAKNKDEFSTMRGRTDIDVRAAHLTWHERFADLMKGEQPFRDALSRVGLADPEIDRYHGDIQKGGILVYVDTDSSSGGPGLGEHIAEGLSADDPLIQTTDSGDDYDQADDVDDEARLQLHEEKLRVDKTKVESGEVKLGKHVVEEEQSVDVPVSREEVYIERRPVGEEAAKDEAAAAFETDTDEIRIPLTEERVEVTKKPVVNEEIIIGKKEVKDTETVSETVRREEADIKGLDHLNGKDGRSL